MFLIMINDKELNDILPTITFKGNKDQDYIKCLAIGTDKETIVSADGKIVRVWKLSSGTCLWKLEGHNKNVTVVAIATTNDKVVSGSWDGTARVWCIKTGRCLKIFNDPNNNPYPDGVANVIMLGKNNDHVIVSKPPLLKAYSISRDNYSEIIQTDSYFVSLALLNHSTLLSVSGYDNPLVEIYSFATNRVIERFMIEHYNIEQIAVSSDNDIMVSRSGVEENIKVWSLKRRCWIQDIVLESGYRPRYIALAEDNDALVISSLKSAGDLGTSKVHIYSIKKSVFLWESDIMTKPYNCDYRLSVPLIRNNQLYIVTIVDQDIIFRYACNLSEITDKKKLILDTETQNVGSGTAIMPSVNVDCKSNAKVNASTTMLKGHTDVVTCVDVGSDNDTIVSGSRDKTVRTWSLSKNKCVRVFEKTWLGFGTPGHSGCVYSVSIGPNNDIAVSGSRDKTVRGWSIKNGICIREFSKHKESVNSVFLANDNDTVVSGSSDHTINIFSLKTGNCRQTIHCDAPVRYVAITSNYREVIYQSEGTFERRYIDLKETREKTKRCSCCIGERKTHFALGTDDIVLYHADIGNSYVNWVTSLKTGFNIAQLEANRYYSGGSKKFALTKNNDIAVMLHLRWDAKNPWQKDKGSQYRADVWSLRFGRWLMGLHFYHHPNQIKLLERNGEHIIIAACSDNNLYLHRLGPPRWVPQSNHANTSLSFNHKKIKAPPCAMPIATPSNPITESYPILREVESLQNAAIVAALTGNMLLLFRNETKEINLINIITSYMDEQVLSDARFIGTVPKISRPHIPEALQDKIENAVKQLTEAFNIAIGMRDTMQKAVKEDPEIQNIDYETLKKALSENTNLNVNRVPTIIFSYCYQSSRSFYESYFNLKNLTCNR